ncbi:MAG: CoA transferase, partial [Pseudomonadota bacterium]
PINRPADMYRDPHVLRPGGLHHSRLPSGQEFRAPGLPIEVDGDSPQPSSLDVSDVGADTETVLSELGMSPSEVRAASGMGNRKTA